MDFIYKEDIVKIECLSTEPQTITNGDFPTNVYTDALLLVPSGCKDIYAKAEIWKNFWNIEEYDTTSTGIANISDPLPDKIIYNLQGHKLSKPQKGINIINGKKVLIK